MSLGRAQVRLVPAVSWVDLCLLGGVFLLIYGLLGVAAQWTGPFQSQVEISLGLEALPFYAFLSLVRGLTAYLFSLLFTVVYGYAAAHSRMAEKILIPLLDILQSIPVLGFLPGLVLALVTLFPDSNLGLELACMLMIFTGQVWNMTFSFYSSVKNVPKELRELSSLYRLKRMEVLRIVEIPHAMSGLLWNSMLSMAGGWFFLMVVESFSLGEQQFRLPGIGSYMAVAIEQSDTQAIVAGIFAMVLIIVLVDRCFWAPLVYLSHRYKLDGETSPLGPEPVILRFLGHSNLLREYYRLREVIRRKVQARRARQQRELELSESRDLQTKGINWKVLQVIILSVVLLVLLLSVFSLKQWVFASPISQWVEHLRDCFYTFLRVVATVVLGSLWAVPVGVWIGTHPKWTRRLQPVVQVVAAFPAPMIFPIITYVLLKIGISFQLISVALMLVGSQWYILFNVIGGATLIPRSLQEVAEVFQLRGWPHWKAVILPAIFPALLNGWITAAGGAWNASIVSEFMQYGDQTLVASGIGASITLAAQNADFSRLAGGIITMITVLVVWNRLFWKRLYALAETRYRMEL